MVEEKGVVALCRCFKSAKFPLCDGAHNKHNEVRNSNSSSSLGSRSGATTSQGHAR